jgi:hypothetical protein
MDGAVPPIGAATAGRFDGYNVVTYAPQSAYLCGLVTAHDRAHIAQARTAPAGVARHPLGRSGAYREGAGRPPWRAPTQRPGRVARTPTR